MRSFGFALCALAVLGFSHGAVAQVPPRTPAPPPRTAPPTPPPVTPRIPVGPAIVPPPPVTPRIPVGPTIVPPPPAANIITAPPAPGTVNTPPDPNIIIAPPAPGIVNAPPAPGSGVPVPYPNFAGGEATGAVGNAVLVIADPPSAAPAIGAAFGLTPAGDFTLATLGVEVARFALAPDANLEAVLAALAGDPRVRLAQPDFAYRTATGDALPQYALTALGVDNAQRLTSGAGVVVCVIDSGVDTGHPAFAGAAIEALVVGDGAVTAHAHGTAIAGIIAATGTVRGVAPEARLLAVQAFEPDAGAAGRGVTSTVAPALDLCLTRGAQVVNMSFEGPADFLFEQLVIQAALRGVHLVAATGNGATADTAVYPAAYQAVIGVTAIDDRDRLYASAATGAHVDLAAPGVDVLTLAPGGSVAFLSGTSIAAAHASGVVALLLARQPALFPALTRQLLARHAHDLGAPGRDPAFGDGRIDAYTTLAASLQGAAQQ